MNANLRTWMCVALLALLPLTAWGQASPRVEVRIEGIEGQLLANVRGFLSIERYRDMPNLSAASVQRMHARAPAEIRQALEPFGYYQPEIKSTLSANDTGWIATYVVDPGTPVRVRDVDVVVAGAGHTDKAFTQYLAALPMQSGQVLEHARYQQIKDRLQSIAAARGYLDARFTASELLVNPAEHRADAHLHLATGPRFKLGKVTFKQDILDPDFLHRYVRFKPGSDYAISKLLNLQYALGDSDYFTAVDVNADRARAKGDEVPVVVEMQPRKRQKYSLGLGYGTDTGPRISLGWENRRVNRRGHRFATTIQVSRVATNATAAYTIPLADPTRERLTLSATGTSQELGGTINHHTEFKVARTTMLAGWQQTAFVQWQRDRNEINDTSTLTRLVVPGITWTATDTDDPIFTRDGSRWLVDLRGSHVALASDTSFAQIRLQGKLIRPLGAHSRLLLRGEAGASVVSDFTNLPLSQRFFAGGDQSVRGFGYNQLGPTDASGTVVGGRDLLVGSVELDTLPWGNWGLAAFFDAGNAMDSFTTPLHKSVGVGLRWKTPIGMVRLDLAHPIRDPDYGRLRVHISLGPDL